VFHGLLAELSPIEEITELQVAPRAESINRFLDAVRNEELFPRATLETALKNDGPSIQDLGSSTSRSGLAYGGGVRSTP
jgi:hypothetical protein